MKGTEEQASSLLIFLLCIIMDVVQPPTEQVGIFQVRKSQGQDVSFTPEGAAAQSNFSPESSPDLESLRSRPG